MRCGKPAQFVWKIYNRENAMKLSALGVLLLMSCAASQTSQPPAGPWSIHLTTSGGITGRGNGTWSLASDGKGAVTTMNGKSCAFEATPEQRARFETLLANARPDTWN